MVSSSKRGHAIVYARFDDELAATVQARATDTARYEFDPAGFSQDTEFPLYICGAELKHARFAILAWLNLVVPGVSRIRFPGEPWSSNARRSLLLVAYKRRRRDCEPAASSTGTTSPPNPHPEPDLRHIIRRNIAVDHQGSTRDSHNPEIPTTAQPRLCCRSESPIGEVEGGDFIDSDGGIVLYCDHCGNPAHVHGHGTIHCWRMRCSHRGLL